ncbi:M20/M25/M40 family metallo-hydrolase [uncultured Peptoniphilus sp.]|uniref:M20/M25/M40 family metallo-hydrolase n=1 Tax=uncultured Peptoniphilus sp. TaxID=254354 RepID=UPI002805532F|nr:M20/M25/M40 family metallo-hydrolase [uncultured Peptoniphilus sp.]
MKKREEKILDYIKKYMKVVTHTTTEYERNNKKFFEPWFIKMKKESKNPIDYGFFPVHKDALKREIPWLLMRGKSKKTIVFIHHTDTVDVDDYGKLKDIAYDPEKLEEIYKSGEVEIDPRTKADLDAGGWLFGRGGCDMKQGGAMHMALFEEYSLDEDFPGSILLMGVPDEENSSAGMRSAAYLLEDLYNKYDLDYGLMINSEPHERLEKDTLVVYDGAIGKIMPICLARGKLAHVGQVYSGFNPINIMAEIVRRTELNPIFSEVSGNTTSPAATWLYFKDRKEVYDVSLPIYCGGYMSILPLKRGPKELMNMLREISVNAFDKVIADMEESYAEFKKTSKVLYGEMNYKANVKFYNEVYDEILKSGNPNFLHAMKELEDELIEKIEDNKISRAEAAYRMMEKLLEFYDDRRPLVMWGIAPPYYPSTNNMDLLSSKQMNELIGRLQKFSKEKLNSDLEVQNYYTGICDLSYGMFTESDEVIDYIKNNMILWGDSYEIPLELIKKHSMNVLNLGAWGKDFHQYTERVLIEDLCDKVPKLIDFTVHDFLGH